MSRLILIFLVLSCLAVVSSAQASEEKKENIWEISEEPGSATKNLPIIFDLDASAGLIFERFDSDHYLSETIQFSTAAEYEATSWLWLNALFDTGYLSYEDGGFVSPDEDADEGTRSASDFFAAGDPIRGISVTTGYSGVTLQLGRIPHSIGEGLVYENYGLGAIARLDGEAQFDFPIRAELSTQMVGSKWSDYSLKNTISSVHLEYDFSHYESIYLLGAYYRERENNFTNVLLTPFYEPRLTHQYVVCAELAVLEAEERLDPQSTMLKEQLKKLCNELESSIENPNDEELSSSAGDLGYLGIGGNLFLLNQLSIRGVLIGMIGSGNTTVLRQEESPEPAPPPLNLDANFRALAGQLEATVVLNDSWEVSWEFFALSGNPTSLRPTRNATMSYTSFIGISPYWAWSGIFFESGLDRDAYSSRAKVAGDYGRGVAGLGPKVNFTEKDLSLELRALGLYALNEAGSPYAAFPTYGIEINAISDWNITRYLKLATEADIFFPGNSYDNTDVAFRVLGFISGQFNL